jgi:hypothetical protein
VNTLIISDCVGLVCRVLAAFTLSNSSWLGVPSRSSQCYEHMHVVPQKLRRSDRQRPHHMHACICLRCRVLKRLIQLSNKLAAPLAAQHPSGALLVAVATALWACRAASCC